jgi:hypothetical protein
MDAVMMKEASAVVKLLPTILATIEHQGFICYT